MLCGVTDSSLLHFLQLALFYMVTVCRMLCLHTGMRTAPLHTGMRTAPLHTGMRTAPLHTGMRTAPLLWTTLFFFTVPR